MRWMYRFSIVQDKYKYSFASGKEIVTRIADHGNTADYKPVLPVIIWAYNVSKIYE